MKQKDERCVIPLLRGTWNHRFLQTHTGMVVPGQREGDGALAFKADGVSVGGWRVREMVARGAPQCECAERR